MLQHSSDGTARSTKVSVLSADGRLARTMELGRLSWPTVAVVGSRLVGSVDDRGLVGWDLSTGAEVWHGAVRGSDPSWLLAATAIDGNTSRVLTYESPQKHMLMDLDVRTGQATVLNTIRTSDDAERLVRHSEWLVADGSRTVMVTEVDDQVAIYAIE